MASFSEWLRGLGNAGAVTNAAQACRDGHLAERRTDVVLHRLASLRPLAHQAAAPEPANVAMAGGGRRELHA